MLFAQFAPQNEAETIGYFVGIMIAGLVSGGIPFFTGLAMKQNGLAIAGGVVSAGAGALAGCCGGIPVAIFFTIIIVVVSNLTSNGSHKPRFRDGDPYEYDEYGRAFRLPDRVEHPRERDEYDDVDRAEERRDRRQDDDWRRRLDDTIDRNR